MGFAAMMSPQEQFKRAQSALAAGNPDMARTLFRQILEVHPNSAEVHFHLARVELQMGKAKKAKRHLVTALRIRPKEPGIWLALMDAEIALRDKQAIGKLMRNAKAAKLAPPILKQLKNKAFTKNKQGVANLAGASEADFQRTREAYMSGNFKEAVELASQFIEKSPKSAPLHAVRAASFAQMGNLNLAKTSYEEAISFDPEYFEARMQLGQLLLGMGQFQEAGEHLTKAHEMASDSPHVHMSLGILHSSTNNSNKAIEHLEEARKSLPKEPRLQLHLAQSYQAVARADEARAAVAEARKYKLAKAELLILANTVNELGENEEAREILDDLLESNPDSVEILNFKASFDMQAGNFEGLREAVHKLLSMGVTNGSQLLSYARSGKMKKDDPIPAAMEKAFDDKGEEEETRSSLAFALAKVYDDWGEYERSFRFLRQGNDEMRSKFSPSKKVARGKSALAQKIFEHGYKRTGPAVDGDDKAPWPRSIQVTGMPRSGTTLVEQIISSHSKVTAAGEMGVVGQEVTSVLEPIDIEGRAPSSDDLANFGDAITQAYHRLFPEAEFVTDKAIMSCIFTGVFAQALPSGRMVVLRRDPRDNCLSIYKNKFQAGSHTYSTDLEALARQYLYFLDVQAYWHEKAPGSFYEIKYEDLIGNPEEEARTLIDYCGLEWEDACLEFYKNTRRVKTLSAFQVRQKIYSSSVGAWKHYEEELQPLIKILDEGGALEGY